MRKETKYAKYGEQVTIDVDGTYRWRSERSLYSHPHELPTVYKAFGVILLVVYIFLSFIIGSDGFDEWWDFTWHFLLALPVVALVILIAYYFLCWLKGGKYKAVFDMNDKQIEHRQIDGEIKRKDVVGGMLVLAAAGGGLSEPARGINASSKIHTITKFKDVTKIEFKKSSNIIYLYERVGKYDVFVRSEDYATVSNFIISHCPQAKIL